MAHLERSALRTGLRSGTEIHAGSGEALQAEHGRRLWSCQANLKG